MISTESCLQYDAISNYGTFIICWMFSEYNGWSCQKFCLEFIWLAIFKWQLNVWFQKLNFLSIPKNVKCFTVKVKIYHFLLGAHSFPQIGQKNSLKQSKYWFLKYNGLKPSRNLYEAYLKWRTVCLYVNMRKWRDTSFCGECWGMDKIKKNSKLLYGVETLCWFSIGWLNIS